MPFLKAVRARTLFTAKACGDITRAVYSAGKWAGTRKRIRVDLFKEIQRSLFKDDPDHIIVWKAVSPSKKMSGTAGTVTEALRAIEREI